MHIAETMSDTSLSPPWVQETYKLHILPLELETKLPFGKKMCLSNLEEGNSSLEPSDCHPKLTQRARDAMSSMKIGRAERDPGARVKRYPGVVGNKDVNVQVVIVMVER